MTLCDEELMLQVGRGEAAAFETLYDRHVKRAYSFFYRMTGGDAQTSEDLLQELFVRIWRSARSYRPTGDFLAYFFTIARNLVIDLSRKRKRAPTRVDTGSDLDSIIDGIPGGQTAGIGATSPAEAAQQQERHEVIEWALQQLSEEHRMTVLYSELMGFTYREIGDMMGIPPGTVSSRKVYAMRQLKKLLEGKEEIL